MDINQMTLRQKLGQLIVTGFPAETMSEEFIELVKEYKVANTIFFSYNTTSEEQIKKLCEEIQTLIKQETGEYALITIDQEGGVVTRLPEESFNIPGAMAMAQTGNPQMAYRAALLTGLTLKELGINFNLAPVLDINSNSQNPVIGVRSFGKDTKTVTDFGCQMVKGYLDAGVMCSVKHFPGHGDTAVDSHLSLPSVDKTYEELKQVELVPFQEAITCGTTAVTLAHILFPQIEEKKIPATMSDTIIHKVLKNDLGFRGLVISDCMEMNAIKEYFGTPSGVKNAIKAGVDLVFVSHTAATAKQSILELEKAVETGEIPMSRIDDAVKKILHFKSIYAQPVKYSREKEEWNARKKFVKDLFELTVHYINRDNNYRFLPGNKPLFLACGAYRSTLASSNVAGDLHFADYMQKEFGGEALNFSVNPEKEEIETLLSNIAETKGITSYILGTYNGHLNKGQILLAQELEKQKVPMLMIALRNPYDLDSVSEDVAKLTAYEYTIQSFEAIKKLLKRSTTCKR